MIEDKKSCTLGHVFGCLIFYIHSRLFLCTLYLSTLRVGVFFLYNMNCASVHNWYTYKFKGTWYYWAASSAPCYWTYKMLFSLSFFLNTHVTKEEGLLIISRQLNCLQVLHIQTDGVCVSSINNISWTAPYRSGNFRIS